MEAKSEVAPQPEAPVRSGTVDHADPSSWQPHASRLVRFYAHPWTQINLISAIFFCLPGVRMTSYFALYVSLADVPILTLL